MTHREELTVDWRHVNGTIRAGERRRFLALLLHWLLRPLGYLELTDIYKIELSNLPPLFDVPGYAIERATADDINEITQRHHRGEPPAVIKALWSQGHHCFVAKFQGRVIAYNWVAFSAVQEEEYLYFPRPGHAICVDAYTFPEHRGKKLHYLLLLTMLQFAAARGKTAAYTGASLFNVTSWKTHLRIGWQRDFTFCWFRPYFTLKRQPWRLCRERYPVRLEWRHHTWLTAKSPQLINRSC
jgi:hypothetical protein